MSCDLFFFNDTATTEIYTLSLHDALPISPGRAAGPFSCARNSWAAGLRLVRWILALLAPEVAAAASWRNRSEEHTSELQSRQYLVCRLLLEKKKKSALLRLVSPFRTCPRP